MSDGERERERVREIRANVRNRKALKPPKKRHETRDDNIDELEKPNKK